MNTDKLAEAVELERKASNLRKEAFDEKRKRELESKESFEKRTKIRVYAASDYAGFENGEYSIYYGYEKTICANHGTKKCPEECDEYEWAFVAEKNGKEVMRLGTGELHHSKNEDPMFYLLAGVAHLLKSQ